MEDHSAAMLFLRIVRYVICIVKSIVYSTVSVSVSHIVSIQDHGGDNMLHVFKKK